MSYLQIISNIKKCYMLNSCSTYISFHFNLTSSVLEIYIYKYKIYYFTLENKKKHAAEKFYKTEHYKTQRLIILYCNCCFSYPYMTTTESAKKNKFKRSSSSKIVSH